MKRKWKKLVNRLKQMGYIPIDYEPTIDQLKLFFNTFE